MQYMHVIGSARPYEQRARCRCERRLIDASSLGLVKAVCVFALVWLGSILRVGVFFGGKGPGPGPWKTEGGVGGAARRVRVSTDTRYETL